MDYLLVFATFLIALGLTARLTHFVVDDSLTQPLRTKLHTFSYTDDGTGVPTVFQKIGRWFVELIQCVHCTSVWIAAATTTAAVQMTDLTLKPFYFVAWAATLSYLTGLLATWRYAKEYEG